MRLNLIGGIIAVLVIVALIVGYSSVFTVYQTQQALVVRLGEPVRVVTQAGLHFKIPLIDNVIYVDKRILDLENPAQEVIASDQKRLVVDAFARYKITDALKFYQSVGSISAANSRLATLLNSALRRVLGEATLTQVVSDERDKLMARVRDQLDREAKAFGIDVVDVRIRRADLPEQNSQAVYQRMQTERQREAAEFRAQGSQRAQEIRARADREVTVLIADATNKSEQIRGEGDATRNGIFAAAYGKDPDFFAFYRSMQAYEAGLKANDTRMLLRPDSDFFRFFGDPAGRLRSGGTEPARGTAPAARPQAAAPVAAPSPAAPAAAGTAPAAAGASTPR
jgi:membrane protease subunit HflC